MRTRAPRLALLTVLALTGIPVTAQATVTHTEITTPADPAFVLNRLAPTGESTLAYAGTSDGAPGDVLAVRCTYGAAGDRHALDVGEVLVQSDQSFSGTVDLRATTLQTCVLRAVPAEADDSSLDAFTGPRLGLSQVDDEPTQLSPSGEAPTDFFLGATQLRGYAEWRSVSSCGLAYSYPYDASFGFAGDGTVATEPLFNCAGALFPVGTGSERSQIQIDGWSAYTAYGAKTIRGPVAELPVATHAETSNPLTGDVTLTETEPLVFCRNTANTANVEISSLCRHVVSAGVRLVRTITQTAGGRQATVSDAFVATDGAAHQLGVTYDQHVGRDATLETGQGPTQPTFSFGDGPYEARETGTYVTPDPNVPGIIGIQGDPTRADGAENPQGSIIYTTAPTSATFHYANDTVPNPAVTPQGDRSGANAAEFELRYDRPLPASGSVDITHVYTQALTRSGADTLATRAVDDLDTPAVAITSPAGATVVTEPSVRVTGTAGDRFTPVTVTVNGVAVPVFARSWSTTVDLTPGENTITVVGTNGGGTQAQVAETVIYTPEPDPTPTPTTTTTTPTPTTTTTTPPAPVPPCVVPQLAGTTEAAAKQALADGGCTVGQIRRGHSASVRRGTVVAADLSAGSRRGNAYPVALVVSLGRASSAFHVTGVRITSRAKNAIDVSVTVPSAGRMNVLATYGAVGDDARCAAVLKPGPGRRTYARGAADLRRPKRAVFHLSPTATGAAALTRKRTDGRALAVRIHVGFTPIEGKLRCQPVRSLRLR